MPDTLGYRKRIGLVVPSTNTTVQPETDALRVPGVTCHTGRVTIKERPLNTEEAFYEHMDFDEYKKVVGYDRWENLEDQFTPPQ